MFLLCTYVNGDRWPSALEPLLYPTGITFYRPFSYRQEYFHPIQAAQQLSDQAQRDALIKQPTWNWGFFGIRYRQEEDYVSRFVPLRKITITDIRSADVLNIRFRLGAFVIPILDQQRRSLPRFDLTGAVTNPNETKLFIDAPQALAEMAAKIATSEDFPSHFWESFEQELSPVAWEKIRNAVILRLSAVRRRGTDSNISPSQIDSSVHVYGYSFRAGHAYDLALSHYRIVQKGKDVPTPDHQFVLNNPAEEVSSSRKAFQLLGNYRDDDMWVKPLNPTEGPIELALESTRLDQPQAFVDPVSSRMIGLKIPIIVKKKAWATIRWVDLVLSLIGFILPVFLYRFYVHANETTQKVLLLFIAALVSVGINSVKDFFSAKE